MDMSERELFPCGASLDNLRCGCVCASATRHRPHGWSDAFCSTGSRSVARRWTGSFDFTLSANGVLTSPTSRAARSSSVEGGIYIQGRHNRPQGFATDAEKYLEAALDGWRVLRLTELQITAPMIERVITFNCANLSRPPHRRRSEREMQKSVSVPKFLSIWRQSKVSIRQQDPPLSTLRVQCSTVLRKCYSVSSLKGPLSREFSSQTTSSRSVAVL